jgi:hypothetical protein
VIHKDRTGKLREDEALRPMMAVLVKTEQASALPY